MPRSYAELVGLVALFVSSGCAFARYVPGSLLVDHAPAASRQLGPLDVAMELGVDATGAGHRWLTLSIDVGNRESRPCAFDLGAIEIAGATTARDDMPLTIVDARHEIAPVHVDASTRAHVHVWLSAPVAVTEIDRVCVDLAALTPEHPRVLPQPICFARTSEGFAAIEPARGMP